MKLYFCSWINLEKKTIVFSLWSRIRVRAEGFRYMEKPNFDGHYEEDKNFQFLWQEPKVSLWEWLKGRPNE